MARKKSTTIFSATTSQGARNLENFIKLLKKKGIDVNSVDLAKYDFDQFESLDDLLRHYAFKERDPLIQKLLYKDEDEEINAWESQYQQYIHYMANGDGEDGEEEEGNPLEDLAHKVFMIEQAIDGLRSKLERLETLTSMTDTINDIRRQISELKKDDSSNEALKKLESKLEKLESKLEDLKAEEMHPVKPIQTTLEGSIMETGEKPKPKKAGVPVMARAISIVKSFVVIGTVLALFRYYEPFTAMDAWMALFWLALAFASDLVTSYGIYAIFQGKIRASPQGALWSRGRRVNVRGR